MQVTTKKASEITKVGDILVDVWGYSMTIVDYYRVTRVCEKSVVIVPVTAQETATGFLSGISVPRTDGMNASVDFLEEGQPKQYRAYMREENDGRVYFASALDYYGNTHYLRLWDGKARSFNHCD